MAKKKGLQKFTQFELKKKHLLSLKQITFKDLEVLTKTEEDIFIKELNSKLDMAEGLDRDSLLKQIDPICVEEVKNGIWEYNHGKITIAISDLMQDYGCMPSKTALVKKTGLSRPTIDKHLKEYINNPQYLGQIKQFQFMTSKVLAKVYKFAVNGDIRACKLYLECMGNMNGLNGNTNINTQNNYIQINGKVLSQETVRSLSPEQLNTIETILKTALPQPEILSKK